MLSAIPPQTTRSQHFRTAPLHEIGVLTLAAVERKEPPGARCATTGGSLPPQLAPYCKAFVAS